MSTMCIITVSMHQLTMSSVSQIKQTSTAYAPFQSEESWVDSVAEANVDAVPEGTDPTVNHASLTELSSAAGAEVNGAPNQAQNFNSPAQGDAGDASGNAAGDRWDTTTAGAAEKSMEDSFEMVPRPSEEVDTPVPPPYSAGDAGAARGDAATSWADDAAAASGATGNQVGDGWDMKPAGGSAETAGPDAAVNGWADGAADAPVTDGDGFQSVGGRHRGGRGRGRGDGEFRGRGRGRGGFRGDGEFRGRGRGGFRGGRGGEGGEFRGRGRGGRGRGDAPPRP